jgi:hypothetical protein
LDDTASPSTMPTTTSNAAFNQAADVDVQNLKQKPNNDQLLELYGMCSSTRWDWAIHCQDGERRETNKLI